MAKQNLEGKVAIITGSSKGIGELIAYSFAEKGAQIVVSSRNQESIQAVADKINSAGGSAIAIACHVGKKDQLEHLVQHTIERLGGVDILVNNAATNPSFGSLIDMTEDLFDKIINVNLRACMTLSNLCYPIMKKRGGGSIINIASVEGLKPSAGLGIYSVSKAALIMLTKSQAIEWGTDNIRSNAICPGLIKTKFSQALWMNEEMLGKFTKHIPLKRIGQADEISGLASYLASESASYTTGASFTCDGGYMIS